MFGFLLVVFCVSLSVIDKLLANLNIKHRNLLKKKMVHVFRIILHIRVDAFVGRLCG